MSKLPALLAIIPLSIATWAQAPNPTAAPTASAAKASSLRIDSIRKVDPGNMYFRVYARVLITGAGTASDPKRPMFVPAPGQATATAHAGILGYQMQISDDGKWALCEFIGATPQDLAVITASTDPNVKAFVRGKASLDDVLADFSQYKKNYTFPQFTTRVQ